MAGGWRSVLGMCAIWQRNVKKTQLQFYQQITINDTAGYNEQLIDETDKETLWVRVCCVRKSMFDVLHLSLEWWHSWCQEVHMVPHRCGLQSSVRVGCAVNRLRKFVLVAPLHFGSHPLVRKGEKHQQTSYFSGNPHQSGTKPNLVAKFWLPTLVSTLWYM